LKQQGMLLLARSKFNHQRLYHSYSIDKYLPLVKYFRLRKEVCVNSSHP
jgi:hypothetical protein